MKSTPTFQKWPFFKVRKKALVQCGPEMGLHGFLNFCIYKNLNLLPCLGSYERAHKAGSNDTNNNNIVNKQPGIKLRQRERLQPLLARPPPQLHSVSNKIINNLIKSAI